MKIRCAVNQAEALRQGIDAPKTTVLVDIEPATLSEYARDVLADKLVKGHDLTGFEPFHLIRATKEEFLERVASLDEDLKRRSETICKQITSMAHAALKENAGKITFVVARREANGETGCFESSLPDSFGGPCAFWPFWDIALDFEEIEMKSSLKEKFFQNAVDSALRMASVAPQVEKVSEKRTTDRAMAERIAKELLVSADKVRVKALGQKGEFPWTLEEYKRGQVPAWSLDAFLAGDEAEYPAWTFNVPSNATLSKFVPASNLSSSVIEPFLDAFKQLPKGAEVWIKDDPMDAFLNRQERLAFAAWKERGLARFAFCEVSDS